MNKSNLESRLNSNSSELVYIASSSDEDEDEEESIEQQKFNTRIEDSIVYLNTSQSKKSIQTDSASSTDLNLQLSDSDLSATNLSLLVTKTPEPSENRLSDCFTQFNNFNKLRANHNNTIVSISSPILLNSTSSSGSNFRKSLNNTITKKLEDISEHNMDLNSLLDGDDNVFEDESPPKFNKISDSKSLPTNIDKILNEPVLITSEMCINACKNIIPVRSSSENKILNYKIPDDMKMYQTDHKLHKLKPVVKLDKLSEDLLLKYKTKTKNSNKQINNNFTIKYKYYDELSLLNNFESSLSATSSSTEWSSRASKKSKRKSSISEPVKKKGRPCRKNFNLKTTSNLAELFNEDTNLDYITKSDEQYEILCSSENKLRLRKANLSQMEETTQQSSITVESNSNQVSNSSVRTILIDSSTTSSEFILEPIKKPSNKNKLDSVNNDDDSLNSNDSKRLKKSENLLKRSASIMLNKKLESEKKKEPAKVLNKPKARPKKLEKKSKKVISQKPVANEFKTQSLSNFKIPRIKRADSEKKQEIKNPSPKKKQAQQQQQQQQQQQVEKQTEKHSHKAQMSILNNLNLNMISKQITPTVPKPINFVQSVCFLNDLNEKRLNFNNSIGVKYSYFSLLFLVDEYCKKMSKVASLDFNFLYSNVNNKELDKEQLLQLCKLQSRSSGKINFYELFSFDSSLRKNIHMSPMTVPNLSNDLNFILENSSKFSLSEAYVLSDRYIRRLNESFKTYQFAKIAGTNTNTIKVVCENNNLIESDRADLESVVNDVLHKTYKRYSYVNYSIHKNHVFDSDQNEADKTEELTTPSSYYDDMKSKLNDDSLVDTIYIRRLREKINNIEKPSLEHLIKQNHTVKWSLKRKLEQQDEYCIQNEQMSYLNGRFKNHVTGQLSERGLMNRADKFKLLTHNQYKERLKNISNENDFQFDLSKLFPSKNF